MSAETDDILAKFTDMLRAPTGDGAVKRGAGTKIHWTIDGTHEAAMLRHLGRYWNGERKDGDSGTHPLVHMAWRCLALAYQQMTAGSHGQERLDFSEYTDRAPCATKLYGWLPSTVEAEKSWPAAKAHHPS